MATIYHDAEEQFFLEHQNTNIFVKIETGNGQGGGVIVFFENKLLNKKEGHYIINAPFQLEQWITIVVAIKDKLTQTNWTNVIITLSEENKPPQTFKYSREVPNHLDTIIYTTKIKISKSL